MSHSDVSRAPALASPTACEWPDVDLESVSQCPVCGSSEHYAKYAAVRDLWFDVAPGQWTFRECNECSSGFLSPRPTPESLPRAYAAYYTHSLATTKIPIHRQVWRHWRDDALRARYPSWPRGSGRGFGAWLARHSDLFQQVLNTALMRQLPSPAPGARARLLDVGCGSGLYLEWARDAGWLVEGVEPDPTAASVARSKGLLVTQGLLQQMPDQGRYDRICLHHVLEHVYDPLDLLRECAQRLSEEGTLWVETPNWNAPLLTEFGPLWRGLEAPRHLVLLNQSSLALLLQKAGFRRLRWHYNPLAAWQMLRATQRQNKAGAIWLAQQQLLHAGKLAAQGPEFLSVEASRS